jgi:hypothetical protein
MANKLIVSLFSNNGIPKTGLSPIISIWEISSGSETLVVNGSAMTESGDGFYKYNFTSYDLTKDYVMLSDGGGVLANEERYSYAGNETFQEEISSQLWSESTTTYNTTGTMGEAQNQNVNIFNVVTEILKYQKNRMVIDKGNKTLTIYNDDKTTVLKIFDLKNDVGGLSITDIFERDPQ